MSEFGKRLVIIDGKSVFYRGYYALPNLTTSDGRPTGGVYGFAMMALEVVKQLKPNYVCVAWDKSKTNIRKRLELYSQYKAGRKTPPPDFYEQLPMLRELLDALGWPLYEADDYEADDLMGAFAKQAGAEGVESYLITSDLDVLQLINPHTHIYTLKKGVTKIELFNEASFRDKYGIDPHQFIDLKALKGDSSDNIPGVAGVGEKTALDLLKQFTTLDGVYQHLDELKPTLKAKLEAGRDMAYLSKKLVTLMVDAPLKIDLKKAKLQNGLTPEFAALLREFEFKTLLRQAEAVMPKEALAKAEVAAGEGLKLPREIPFEPSDYKADQPRLVALSPDASALWVSAEPKTYSTIVLREGVGEQMGLLGASLLSDSSLASQLVSEGPQSLEARVASGGASPKNVFLPAEKILGEAGRQDPGGALGDEIPKAIKTQIRSLLKEGSLIGHDLKGLIRALLGYNIELQPTIHYDTRIGAFLLNSLQRQRELSDLIAQPIDMAEPAQVIAATWQAYHTDAPKLKAEASLQKLANDIEWPTIVLLAHVEHRGILLDSAYLNKMGKEFAERIKEFEQKIYELAGEEFNISSPAQLSRILFDKLGMPTQGVKKGKTGYSTNANELERLRDKTPLIDLITKYREYTKLKSTYIDALPKQVDDAGKLHTTYHLDVAPTGRLSSADPNLQNIPTRTDIGQAIRRAFVPRPGHVFVSADYSQFELRLAAALADDKQLLEDFNKDIDIHTATAAEVYGVPLDKVTKVQRRNAKVINFGILYGMSPHGLSQATGMTFDESKKFIDAYFALRQPIRDYMDRTVDEGLKEGYVETLFGRRRPTPDLSSSNFMIREAAKRAAINTPIQGTEADLMKLAMLRVEEALGDLGQQLLQIHDSIVVECLAADAPQVSGILKKTMEAIHKLPVKLQVDVSVGGDWGEL